MTDSPSNDRITLLPTGVPGLDAILGGGFPAHSLYLIQGLAGSGKTTLASQIGFHHARQGRKVLVLTLIAETHGKMLNHLSNFSFFDEALVDQQLSFIGAYSSLAKGGLRELLRAIADILAGQQPDLMIVDGFRSVRDARPSDLDLSEFMLSLNSLVSTMRCTTFLLSPTEGNVADSENTLVDGLIELRQYERDLRLVREIKAYKVRGSKHLLGSHVFELGRDGVTTYPRIEAIASQTTPAPQVDLRRLGFGVPGLDLLTNGGIARGSTTNLLGNPGVGKTLLGLHFIHEGLRRGESCLVLGFYESPARLLEKGRSVGLQLAPYVDSGALRIMWHPPLEELVDGVAHRVLEHISRHQVTRLFIDGLDGLRDLIIHTGRARSFLAALVNELRCRDVSTFFTQELPYFSGQQGQPSVSDSVLFENILLLRYIDSGGVHQRQIGVLKLRENGYDAASHLLRISDSGLTIEGLGAGLLAQPPQA